MSYEEDEFVMKLSKKDMRRLMFEITAQMVYDAIKAEFAEREFGYISPDPPEVTDTTVDGVISCEDIAKRLNKKLKEIE